MWDNGVVKKTKKMTLKGPQPINLTIVTTEVNGSNRTLTVGREISLHKTRANLKGGRYRLTGIVREVSGELLLTAWGPLSSVKPKQTYVRPGDVKAIHFKPKKARTTVPVAEQLCDNCMSSTCPGAKGDECQERG